MSHFRRAAFVVVAMVAGPVAVAAAAPSGVRAPEPTPDARALADAVAPFLEAHCTECHDSEMTKGGLDLTALRPALGDAGAFATWVKVVDRVEAGEMPPRQQPRPPRADQAAFTKTLSDALTRADAARVTAEGRSTRRRLNRSEYEDTLRDLLALPGLQVKEFLPEDGESHRFNKVSEALDVSHVNMARYLTAADHALRQAMARQIDRPVSKVQRHHVRDQRSFMGGMRQGPPVRQVFPLIGTTAQPDLMQRGARMTVGDANPALRDQEAFALASSTYEPTEIRFDKFRAPYTGFYKLRFSTYSIWIGDQSGDKFWLVDRSNIVRGRRPEPVTIYSDIAPHDLRRLGAFDAQPDPTVQEMTVWLNAGETVRPDASRLARSRPPDFRNPFAEKDGMPAVAFRWMETEGPLVAAWPPPGHKLLFGDLPLQQAPGAKTVKVVSVDPEADARSLLKGFMARAYRRPVTDADQQRFMAVIRHALTSGYDFTEAMIAGYTAVLCSPEFLYLHEQPGVLEDHALAARLSYFLWNTGPDDQLRRLAAQGRLQDPAVLRAETERLLGDPKASRFVNDFLDYWLDLRHIAASAPDATLYPDYQLDDLLVESMIEEPRLFFTELLRKNLGVGNLVDSGFAMLNERLATHYGIRGVQGVALRRVPIPRGDVRGGLMTQASVLKVTANGTTTSPVIRGAWIMERILGKRPPPPPASVPAVEPDTTGATTIREQLAKHRSQESCAACHRNIDPAGFALEAFDPMGGLRERYRILGGQEKVSGFGHNGLIFAFAMGPRADASGELPDGRTFRDVRGLKRLLLSDKPQLARNLVHQLTVYATGAPVQFGDRPAVARIVASSRNDGYGVRSLVHGLIQSELFRRK